MIFVILFRHNLSDRYGFALNGPNLSVTVFTDLKRAINALPDYGRYEGMDNTWVASSILDRSICSQLIAQFNNEGELEEFVQPGDNPGDGIANEFGSPLIGSRPGLLIKPEKKEELRGKIIYPDFRNEHFN